MPTEDDIIKERLRKLDDLRAKGINPYPYSFRPDTHAAQLQERFSSLQPEERTQTKVAIAGRIVSLRRMGKATFMHVQDQTGKIQSYVKEDDIGAETYSLLKLFDMGDFIGIKGAVFKTKTGEVTVHAESFDMLCKSIRPLPEKFHGLKDTELRYRQRYLDLIMNPDVKKTFEARSKMIVAIRQFLNSKGFMEVETPILQPTYGGANARPFMTHHHELDMKLYLKISPELYLKRLLVGGFEKVYDINKNFRNEGIDTTHNPEFTMMEIYQAYADYNDMMKLTEELYEYVAKTVFGRTTFVVNGKEIDVKAPWKRLSMIDAIKQYAGIDVNNMSDGKLLSLASEQHLEIEEEPTRGRIIQALFEKHCEEHLLGPVHIIDHPLESTPLCKPHRTKEGLIERSEPFINSLEAANLYSELNDPVLQRNLLEAQALALKAGHAEANPMDEDFVRAIEHGMPPAGGVGIGIDRMVMIMTENASIRDIILFPTMKPTEEEMRMKKEAEKKK